MTMWLSVDPMADKCPSISPYAYCAWNPIRLLDPDGCEVADYYDRNGRWLGTDGKNDHLAYVAKSVKKNSKGFVESAVGAQKLSITNIHSLTGSDPTGGCRGWFGGVEYAKPYVDNSNKQKRGAIFQFSFQSSGGYHSFSLVSIKIC